METKAENAAQPPPQPQRITPNNMKQQQGNKNAGGQNGVQNQGKSSVKAEPATPADQTFNGQNEDRKSFNQNNNGNNQGGNRQNFGGGRGRGMGNRSFGGGRGGPGGGNNRNFQQNRNQNQNQDVSQAFNHFFP